MKEKIIVLHVLHCLGSGGTETLIMNWYRNIDRSKVQFHFLIRSNINNFADEINELGGKVFVMPTYPGKYFSNKKETKKFFKEHAKDYSAIHVHGNSLLYTNIFDIAKQSGIKTRIYHSHNASTNPLYIPLHMFNRKRIKKLATNFLACSNAAAKWAYEFDEYTVLKNGISPEQFSYDEEKRYSIRNTLGITNETVYGHVGRFTYAKNHTFLLDVFDSILKRDKNSTLLLIGDGELIDEVKKTASKKGLSDNIKFLGRQKNIADFMNAMDVFLFPSIHEGLGIVAVEAQATGLPVLLSDTITKEVKIIDSTVFLPITDVDIWCNQAMKSRFLPRKSHSEEIIDAGYDISEIAKLLEEFYFSCINQ